MLSDVMFPSAAVSGRQADRGVGGQAVQRSAAHQTERKPPHA